MQAIDSFRAELEAADLCPAEIIPDGQLHRCPTKDKPRGQDGAYLFHNDEAPAGWLLNWRTGEERTWTAGPGRSLSDEERRSWVQVIEREKAHRQAERKAAWAAAAEKARELLEKAQPCNSHPYLEMKKVQPCPKLKVDGQDMILVPVLNPEGKPQSLQTISPEGEKRFFPGGKMAGGYFPIKGGDDRALLVCEGLATGLSLHHATGYTVLVAFTAGNLEAVAMMAHGRYPAKPLIVCADNDHATEGNPGLTKATKAAQAVQGKVALPVFKEKAAGTDFNDLHQAEGPEAVQAQVETAKEPAQSLQEKRPPAHADWPFRVIDSGVYKRVEREDKQAGETKIEWVPICSRLDVLAETRDAEGRNWGRLLAVTTREGGINHWAMPMDLLAGDGSAYRAELLSLGLEVRPGRFAREALHEFISTARPDERARCVDRIGWHGSVFVLPDKAYGQTNGERVLFQVGTAQDHPFGVAGSLQEWQTNLAQQCIGNSRLALAVSMAFAAPLLHLAGIESGGIHLRGGSSIGKTTALLLAGSVWGGGGIKGYCRNWRATANGLEAIGSAQCDTLLCLDEMGQVDGKEAGEVAYMLANGQGKSRARKDGSGRKPAQWRVLFLSTGEISLAAKMNEAGRRTRAGQEVRLVDIPADANAGWGIFEALHGFATPGALADHLRQAACQYYGSAARAFLERITAKLDGLGETVRQARQEFVERHCPQEADGQVKRVAGRFALVAAAGTLATAVGILPWPDEEAERAAAACFRAWLDHRGGAGAQEDQAALEAVRTFIQTHGQSRFQPWEWDGKSERVIHNRAGFIRQAGQGREYLIFPETFRQEVCNGLDPVQVTSVLRTRGLLVMGGGNRSAKVERLPGEGKSARMYVIKGAVLGDDEDD